MELNEIMKNTADAIREKTGKSDLIAPVDFAEEIKGISVGGGESASTIEYLDVSGLDKDLARTLAAFSIMMRFQHELQNGTRLLYAANTSLAIMGGDLSDIDIYSIAIDWDMVIIVPSGIGKPIVTMREYITYMDMMEVYNSLPRITKEQFYAIE